MGGGTRAGLNLDCRSRTTNRQRHMATIAHQTPLYFKTQHCRGWAVGGLRIAAECLSRPLEMSHRAGGMRRPSGAVVVGRPPGESPQHGCAGLGRLGRHAPLSRPVAPSPPVAAILPLECDGLVNLGWRSGAAVPLAHRPLTAAEQARSSRGLHLAADSS